MVKKIFLTPFDEVVFAYSLFCRVLPQLIRLNSDLFRAYSTFERIPLFTNTESLQIYVILTEDIEYC